VNFSEVFSAASNLPQNNTAVTAICLLLFVGAMGKSAQMPLYTWLPDAMAGPTPVSALIHAATMVTAGIYMVVRSNVLYALSPDASSIVAFVGIATAFFAATIGLKQNDIKKVLAYSTVSQLGYMFVALGVGAYQTALFHVITHAFFKALLFLGAGSVIHAMSGEQDIRRMGALKKALPITHLTFLIGTLAIAGLPPFAGFFSKDEILAKVWMYSPIMFVILAITSVLTAVYMFRLYWLTFYGEFRGSEHQKSHLHESPATMTIPLIVLAVLSAVGGFIGMPEVFYAPHFLDEFLAPIIFKTSHEEASHTFEIMLMSVSVVLLAVIMYATYSYYVTKKVKPEEDSEELDSFAKLLANKYYVDEVYAALITKPLDKLAAFVYKYIDQGLIDGTVNGTGTALNNVSGQLRKIQTGHIGAYVFAMVIGIITILVLTMII
jgi:NADH-quinone oxidoreductase subunit L